jgi:hypothetical protein
MSPLQMKTRPVIDVAQLLWKIRHFSENQSDEREKSYRHGNGHAVCYFGKLHVCYPCKLPNVTEINCVNLQR